MGGSSVCQAANGYPYHHALAGSNSDGLAGGGFTISIVYARTDRAGTDGYFHPYGYRGSYGDADSYPDFHRDVDAHPE